MKKQAYRMSSWWLTWEDLIFPEPGITDKIIQRAEKFQESGIDTVIIFGFHFRWDYIYNWERVHLLLKFIVDICHQKDIKVFDHHSATLVHRVDSMDDYDKINRENRHHVPLFPSREFADTISFDGHKLNDFRMKSVQNGNPCDLRIYNAEMFCMNNTNFVNAYIKYVEILLDTGIDGLMCDDVIYYPGWDSCACEYCRKKFKDQYGHDLPSTDDESFWGNYESAAFKDWVNMRYHDSADFLAAVRETVGHDFPLMSCTSRSSNKTLDKNGMNAGIMVESLNHIMLEMCGEIASDNYDYFSKLPDFMLHKAIADEHSYPNIGLGYAHNPDSAFVIWAFNKMFNSSTWISTLTGRFGVSEDIRRTIPDEADIIKEAFNFEKENTELFRGESSASLAVLFSIENLVFNGCVQSDYSRPWQETIVELARNNIQFDIVTNIPDPADYPFLMLSNYACVSDENDKLLRNYVNNGGTIIAGGLLGNRNERGIPKSLCFLANYGIDIKNYCFDWNIPSQNLFDTAKYVTLDNPSNYDVYHKNVKSQMNEWIEDEHFYWLPKMDSTAIAAQVEKVVPVDKLNISCPDGWMYRVLKDENSYFIHILACDLETIPYDNFKNNKTNEAIIEKINFKSDGGKVHFACISSKAVVHSPDLKDAVELKSDNGQFNFDLNAVKRYLIIKL